MFVTLVALALVPPPHNSSQQYPAWKLRSRFWQSKSKEDCHFSQTPAPSTPTFTHPPLPVPSAPPPYQPGEPSPSSPTTSPAPRGLAPVPADSSPLKPPPRGSGFHRRQEGGRRRPAFFCSLTAATLTVPRALLALVFIRFFVRSNLLDRGSFSPTSSLTFLSLPPLSFHPPLTSPPRLSRVAVPHNPSP